MFWNGKPLSSWKNRSWAQEEAKPRRKRGLKVQSPILGRGVGIIVGGPSEEDARQTVDQLISYLNESSKRHGWKEKYFNVNSMMMIRVPMSEGEAEALRRDAELSENRIAGSIAALEDVLRVFLLMSSF